MEVGPTTETRRNEWSDTCKHHSHIHSLSILMANNPDTTITIQPLSFPDTLVDDTIDTIIHYQPASELISYNWQTAQDVLNHLILHPEDRHSLLQEAQQRSPQWPKLFFVTHPLLPCMLQVNSFETDGLFLATLYFLQRTLEPSPMVLMCLKPPSALPIPLYTPPRNPEVPFPPPPQKTYLSSGPSCISVFRLQSFTKPPRPPKPSKQPKELPPLFTYQPLPNQK